SVKPDEVRDRIVQLVGDLPRIELFAREQIEGWDAIGYDIDGLDIRQSLEWIALK
ncbi:MAG: DNA methyltransferase, partial [Candidatus Moranbacteria bacterium CG_4_9_14_3_um_filter_40_7]